MGKKCLKKFQILNDIDLFGKEIELYYKGNSKNSTAVGIISTVLFMAVYLAFFLYSLIRMLKREEITFFDSYSFNGEPPFIELNKDIFYFGFALFNYSVLTPFYDPTIYTPVAFHVKIKSDESSYNFVRLPLELESCKLEKFGEKYHEQMKLKKVERYLCPKNLDILLEGHKTYNKYSTIVLKFFPCMGRPDCKDINTIKKVFANSYSTVLFEDMDLTPKDYYSPYGERRREEFSTYINFGLFQDVYYYFKVVNIETDQDVIGFEFTPNFKKEKRIMYDNSIIRYSTINENEIYANTSLCTITMGLSDKELTETRSFKKLIEILGDIGGFMEIIFSFFKVILFSLTEIIYETSLVNHLFSFDVDRKLLILKEKKNVKTKDSSVQNHKETLENPAILNDNKNNLVPRHKLIINKKKGKTNQQSLKIMVKNKTNSNSKVFSFGSRQMNSNTSMKQLVDNLYYSKKSNNINYLQRNIETMKGKSNRMSEKININKFCLYCCFFCVRRRNNMQNILLDEGTEIIRHHLDIQNIFNKVYKVDKIAEKLGNEELSINMSKECQKKLIQLQDLFRSNYYY